MPGSDSFFTGFARSEGGWGADKQPANPTAEYPRTTNTKQEAFYKPSASDAWGGDPATQERNREKMKVQPVDDRKRKRLRAAQTFVVHIDKSRSGWAIFSKTRIEAVRYVLGTEGSEGDKGNGREYVLRFDGSSELGILRRDPGKEGILCGKVEMAPNPLDCSFSMMTPAEVPPEQRQQQGASGRAFQTISQQFDQSGWFSKTYNCHLPALAQHLDLPPSSSSSSQQPTFAWSRTSNLPLFTGGSSFDYALTTGAALSDKSGDTVPEEYAVFTKERLGDGVEGKLRILRRGLPAQAVEQIVIASAALQEMLRMKEQVEKSRRRRRGAMMRNGQMMQMQNQVNLQNQMTAGNTMM